MKMKKCIIGFSLVFLIPYLVVTFLVKEEDRQVKFQVVSNQKVRVKQEATGTIIEVPFEEYITGVLAGEMPINFDLEALKAQAVAARSYVLKKMEQNQGKEYDVVDTVANQVYLDDATLKERWKDGYTEKMNKLKQAVVETKGEYLQYQGEVVEAFFFSTSTGKTENCEEVFTQALPYLRSVDSQWDSEVSPVFSSSVDISLLDFYSKLNLPYQTTVDVQITKTTSTGRVKELTINGQSFTGNQVYSALGLRSTFFTISQVGNNIHVDIKGFGHGVGMSQYGALAMAKKGYTYDQILKHYYQGVEIVKI